MRNCLVMLAAAALVGCGDSTGPNALCAVGETECQGQTLRTCAEDGQSWLESTCEFGCQGGACIACQPGEARCEGSTRLVCTASGSGWTPETCPSGCDSATGTCKTQACTPNQKKCSGQSLMTCQASGAGWDTVACEFGCNASVSPPACHTEAQTCTAGQKQCNGAKLLTCRADGLGWDELLCQYGCDPATTPPACKGAACSAGQKRCSPDNPKVIQTCNADLTGWVDSTICPGTCNPTTFQCEAGGTCTPNEEACRQNVETHRDEIDKCSVTGTWQTAHEVCTAGSCYDAGGTPKQFACGTCWKDERSCQGETVMECANPQSGPTSLLTCVGTELCVAGTCSTAIVLGASQTVNYRTLAQAFVDCWVIYSGATQNQMCANIDGQSQSTDISYADAGDWVCNTATAGDFLGGQSDYDVAYDLFGCSWTSNSEIFWWWDPLPAGTILEACIWYHPSGSIFFDDEDTLDHCENFWLK